MISSPGSPAARHATNEAVVYGIERPHPKLWTYYILSCLPFLLFPPLAVLLGLVLWFRYHTMRYRFDASGINMRWGILFRREVILNYARIQDIHLLSNFVERWLGLARIQIQTASGSASPEMTIEGILEFEQLRDFLYAKMRGIKEHAPDPARSAPELPRPASDSSPVGPELAAVLREVTAELRALRHDLQARNAPPKNP